MCVSVLACVFVCVYVCVFSDEEEVSALDWLPAAPEIDDPEEPGWGQLEVSLWVGVVNWSQEVWLTGYWWVWSIGQGQLNMGEVWSTGREGGTNNRCGHSNGGVVIAMEVWS